MIRLRYGTWVVLITFAVYLLHAAIHYEPYTFALYDCGWAVTATESLVKDGDLDLKNQLQADPAQASDQIAIGTRGEWYLLHEYLLPFLATPFYLVLGVNGCLAINLILSAGTIFLAFLFYRHFIEDCWAALGALLMAVGTLMLPYSYSFSSDVCGAFFFLAASVLLFSERSFGAGFFWGIAVLARNSNAFTLPALLYILLTSQKKTSALLQFALGGLPAFLVFTGLNTWMFGGPLTVSYFRWAPYQNGELVLHSQRHLFATPLFEGLSAQLFDVESGLMVSYPLLIFALFLGAKEVWNRAPKALYFSLLCLVSLVIPFSLYPGSSLSGNRYLMSPILLLGLPLCVAVKRLVETLPRFQK